MLDIYVNSQNTLYGLESALRISVSNANNFSTPGYKHIRASFTTVYTEVISLGTKSVNPLQLGSAATIGSTSTDFTQGATSTGTALDAAIIGEGFFMVSASPVEFSADADKLYTRSGEFQIDNQNKFLVDSFGRKVYGYKVDQNGNPVSNELEPISTNGATDIGFTEGGILVKNFEAGNVEGATVSREPMYRLAMTSFHNKDGLVGVSGGAWKAEVAAGEPFKPGVSGQSIDGSTSHYGDIFGEALEASNVDVARVSLDMNILTRSYSAVQAMIDDVTKILTSIIPKIGG